MMESSPSEKAFKREDPDTLLFGLAAQTQPITVENLRNGLLLVDILRAVVAARGGETPDFGYATQLNMLTYRTNTEHVHLDMREQEVIGLIYSANSSRSPLNTNGRSYFTALTTPIPEPLHERLNLISAIFKQKPDAAPWITTALWSEHGQLTTPGSWDSFLEHGGWTLERLLMDHRSALRGYQRVYGLTERQTALAASIFERKAARPRDWVLLTEADFAELIADGHAGLTASTNLFLNNRIHQPYRV
jgi:hypothetical protein